MTILGIESSCDETSASVIEAKNNDKKVTILSNVVASSLRIHAKTGGIIPENAAREQVKYIIPVITKALKDSNLYPPSSKNYLQSSTIYRPNIDAIAVTVGPGLIGSLLVGVETAKTLAYVWQKPIIPVNHLIGHIYANFIRESSKFKVQSSKSDTEVSFPAISLIVSGAHTDLVLMKKHGDLQLIGGTRDDAAGECFDKCARLLGYDYPGGPKISQLAEKGNPKAFQLPRPMTDSKDFDFSFSGLKAAFMRLVNETFSITNTPVSKNFRWKHIALEETLSESKKQILSDLCASLEQAIVDVLVSKTLKVAQKYKVKSILLGGGVAANQKLRTDLQSSIINLKSSIKFFAPPKSLCTDNAAMIASAAFFNHKPVPWQNLTANPELYFN
ncbi:MAG: tRNA (adenosine(37)-N6)-threonylcarbamoyltransferase complex transferase subunit TsaD [Candidatus Levybacteria bacterium RIFCSPHIGHO2_02_FULL_37_13]|nr:MAG: tRNA (adenosine(37)-N6)-threonylcarbamoyltransferase complex transferase subunit TsaD [Candidatus Levybacteria bacterium RIFCSPHIGHO2_02_FULL_37_13]OGH29932.1 MAG: tRNA (adenosine(37)-N6)-threonylcarbamoyltransferase complex transferase subunit TsaD [Candidatus Levybacteria bacterium RIFCSPHIGHO2_12_FULL_37_9]OGH39741.1 MAG: tRNA (adenosine(37)-N6)-threonylcarbamoyltransferase complex transferase subunit TsaD [Candidatus Levybacteria bacterium RIFCSPLOWO2_01_FULL_37_26]